MEGEFDQPSTPAEPASAAPEAKRDSLGSVHLLIIGAALIGSGALMITVLSARTGTAVVEPSVSARPVSTPARPAVDSGAADMGGGWIENTDQWTPRTRRRVAFELPATSETPVWMKNVRPLLVVRCVQGQIESFVFTDSPAVMEPQDEDHSVRLWFDEGAPQTDRWPDSSAHDALFAPDGALFTARLMQAQTFRFGYNPHNAAPVVAKFQVAGLREKVESSPACQSPKKTR